MPVPGDSRRLASLDLPNTTVDSVVDDPGDAETPASCRVQLTVTHPPAGDRVTIWVHLPVDSWNGRFQGRGGGGFLGGSAESLLEPLREGYACAATDAGHPDGSASFALDARGRLDWQAIRDFGHLGIHDMTVAARAVVTAFYGQPPAYSYFHGCSTGGRQGLMTAQRYPADYDGVLSGAPAINWPRMQVGQIWGQLVMLEAGNPVSSAKFEAALAAIVDQCDLVGDGVRDGVVGDPLGAEVDLAALVGLPTPDGELTEADVEVVRLIGEGPRRRDGSFLWYGLAPGAPFAGLNDTAVVDGELVGQPFVFDVWWISLFLEQDPSWDWRTLTREAFEAYFDRSVEMYSAVLAADDPDLSAFAGRGGKALLWHGAADFGIPFQGTVDYYERVRARMGAERTDGFLRLFLAPGVGHCGGGAGPQPTGQFEALVAWVEQGRAPEVLTAVRTAEDGEVRQTRPLFPYPGVARWTGEGDPDDAARFTRAEGTRLVLPDR
ncbi:tannase/feruloyl esterase family alpha/beta hydrolase [Geodermatophilus sabuli]|uniref:Tannase/feruloyl esterase family alpha/beta hydrolase n=1 Tax=Geodermatophilus sabuli TaxID=1564158 RepID=A0A7K3VUU8_9ACTN|nr:tannase/feruloyl esterase family alpha/beta hydrolase [Geodermatophilus sabuli]NEK56421.1 tannase/feruloyl esterase family alpha/beta hydrolase [Geodermatophilus sabuli]